MGEKFKERTEKAVSYKYYGARGIKVCDSWLDKEYGFLNFFRDMGKKPSKNHSIDRIDNDGNYEPNNCRWATTKEQRGNKRKACREHVIMKRGANGRFIKKESKHVN